MAVRMGLFVTTASSAGVLGTSVAVLAATQGEGAASGVDIWTLMEKGGAPMAAALLLLLIEVTRRHDRAYKIIEAKDATILELSKRQTTAIETSNGIATDQMKTARSTEALLREMVTLWRGKMDV